jgi:hypothetical protein
MEIADGSLAGGIWPLAVPKAKSMALIVRESCTRLVDSCLNDQVHAANPLVTQLEDRSARSLFERDIGHLRRPNGQRMP